MNRHEGQLKSVEVTGCSFFQQTWDFCFFHVTFHYFVFQVGPPATFLSPGVYHGRLEEPLEKHCWWWHRGGLRKREKKLIQLRRWPERSKLYRAWIIAIGTFNQTRRVKGMLLLFKQVFIFRYFWLLNLTAVPTLCCFLNLISFLLTNSIPTFPSTQHPVINSWEVWTPQGGCT